MRKVALFVVTSFGLSACSDSIFSPDWSRRPAPQFSSLSVGPPPPYASERQDPTYLECRASRLTC
jgi:hypothetical protein